MLRDLTDRTGITFRHTGGSSGRYYIMETMSAGLALFDYDNDGHVSNYVQFSCETHQHVDQIEVRWIVGGIDVVENVRVDQRVRLIERLEDL